MPTMNEDIDNIHEFIKYIKCDLTGNINVYYVNYIKTINNLINQNQYEINIYNKNNFPPISNLINKSNNLDERLRMFCVYLWYYVQT